MTTSTSAPVARVGSLFSGIGGFDLGLERAGMEVAWQVEFDAKARSVLRRHWPAADLHEDVCDVGTDELAPVDLICGGFPCQDLSVAGKRRGLAGDRSGLWWEFHRILGELAPRWVLIENVPGLLSGCGCVMCRAAKRTIRVHEWARSRSGALECDVCHALKGMLASHSGRNMAIVLQGLAELGYGWSYRVLDAQYFGVAQRRRRVFIVGHLGGVCPPEILFEPDSVSGDSAPSREAWSGATPLLEVGARTNGDGYRDGDGIGRPGDPMYSLQASKQHGVAHTLRGEGFDASEDGTGRGTPLVLSSGQANAELLEMDGSPVVYQCHGSNVGPMGALRAGNGNEAGGVPFLAFDPKASASRSMNPSDVSPALETGKTPAVYRKAQKARDPDDCERWEPAEYANTLAGHSTTTSEVIAEEVPRRLTPRECERLQGFPDDWTRYADDGTELADSPRYRMLGNAVAVPVAEWIGHRIMGAA